MDFIVCISKVLSLAVIRAILSLFYPENYCSPWPIGSKQQKLATSDIKDDDVAKWKKVEMVLEAYGSDANSILQLTTSKRSTIWLDQVSALPLDTHNGHGFRQDLFDMLAALKPGFIRFPGGSFVEGDRLMNAFRWRETIGSWEERPGRFNDVWQYWTDDGLGYFEYLQLAEDLGASPVWVVNIGNSRNDQVDTSLILPFVQYTLDAIEFARGDASSTMGSGSRSFNSVLVNHNLILYCYVFCKS